MTFEEILDQAIEMLQRRGRLTYRALKLQFNLDDEYLDALKDELIEGQQLAVDENGRVLIWIGDSEATPVTASQPAQTSEQPAVKQQEPSPQTEPPTPDAERRQLTVMFCDLADSTKLSGQLDPEDLRDVIRAYQSTSADVIEQFDGYIAQHLGDGLMVYFGWPRAHEDDAQRAVHAGLGIIEAMLGLNVRLEREKGVRLTVRIGIHTGLVVIGEIGKGASQEQLALGEAPNIASRIEGITEGLATAEETSESCDIAELYRLKGMSLLGLSGEHDAEAESCFQSALGIARNQQAKSLELRAATSLARLWQSQGKRQDAYELLDPVYGWFTEGFDTADLKDARALLEELA